MSVALTVRDRQLAFREEFRRRESQFTAILPPTLPFARFEQIVSMAMVRNPDLIECSPVSIFASCMQAAELGLEVGGILGEAFLVPFRCREGMQCTLIVGYKGMISLAYQSDSVLAIRASLVYHDDEFRVHEGSVPRIEHMPAIGPKRDVLGSDVFAAYAIAHLAGGVTIQHVMGRDDLEQVRSTAKSARKPSSPWHVATSAMYKKTVLRRLCATLPLSEGLKKAMSFDSDQESYARSRLGVNSIRERLKMVPHGDETDKETPDS